MQRDFGKDYASVSHCPSPTALDLRSCKQIPPHGRWRHLDAGLPRVQPLIEKWNASASPPDIKEVTKRLLDLFLVSVLLDAGAGNAWAYYEAVSEQKFTRSEGLGVASMHMFQEGFFSGDRAQPYRVDGMSRFCRVLEPVSRGCHTAAGLAQITVERTAQAMQVDASNPMVGLEGRASLLKNLSRALKQNPVFFGDGGRPGNILGAFVQRRALPSHTPYPVSFMRLPRDRVYS